MGSSSFITDASGEAQQHMEYFPFGETFVEEHHGHDRYSNYKFNGKELDEETGLYYYGARYYDPRISMFYGVDPLAEKYFYQTPYAYAANNPIRFIDVNGEGPGNPVAFRNWAMSNPFGPVQEGFRQMFDAALSMVSVVAGVAQEVKTNISSFTKGNVTNSTDLVVETSKTAKIDFSKVLDLNGTNTPNKPDIGIETKTETKIVNETKVKGNIEGVPVSISYSNELNSNGDNTNSVKGQIGGDNTNVYVKGSTTTGANGNTTSNTAIGLEVATPAIKGDKKTTVTYKANAEIRVGNGK